MNIAIDGPAGAGKSSIAKLVAERLSFIYIDTGAMYRTMALYFMNRGINTKDQMLVESRCEEIDIRIHYENGEQQIFLNGENVSVEIREEQVGNEASVVASYGKVREKLVALQRSMAASSDVIMDGRDIGTNVLPEASPKIYLTASVKTRAARRYAEQKERGLDCTLEEIEKDIEERDYRDMHRECAPLTVAEGAVLLDTSDMNIDEAVNEVIKIIDRCKA